MSEKEIIEQLDEKDSLDLLEGIIYSLNKGYGRIIDQKKFDEGISRLMDGIDIK